MSNTYQKARTYEPGEANLQLFGRDEDVAVNRMAEVDNVESKDGRAEALLCGVKWMQQADKLKNGEISKEDYNEWRYKYPALDTYQKCVKVPSQELSDYFVQELSKKK